jgi:hypothetical protein
MKILLTIVISALCLLLFWTVAAQDDAPTTLSEAERAAWIDSAFDLLDAYAIPQTALDDLLARRDYSRALTEQLKTLGLDDEQSLDFSAEFKTLIADVDASHILEHHLAREFFSALEATGLNAGDYHHALLNLTNPQALRLALSEAGLDGEAIAELTRQLRQLRDLGLDTDVVNNFITRDVLSQALQERLSDSDVNFYLQAYETEGRDGLFTLLVDNGLSENAARDFFSRFDTALATTFAGYGFDQKTQDQFLLTAATYSLLKDATAAANDPYAVEAVLEVYGLDEETAREFILALQDLPTLDKLLRDYGVDYTVAAVYYYDADKFIPEYIPPQVVTSEGTAEPTIEAVNSGGEAGSLSGPGESAAEPTP